MSPAQNPAWPTIFPPFCPTVAPMCPPPPQAQGGQAQAQTPFPTIIACPTVLLCTGGQAQAQTIPTLSCTLPIICLGAQAQQGGQAQAQTAYSLLGCPTAYDQNCPPPTTGAAAQGPVHYPTIGCVTGIPHACPSGGNGGGQAQTVLTAPPHCGGIHTNATICPPPAAGGQAQAQTVPTFGCVVTSLCITAAGSPAQPQTHYSVPPFCPTVAPLCPPPAAGSQAQAQTPVSVPLCPTVIPQLCPTHIPIICSQAQQGGQAQAQTPVLTFPPFCPAPATGGGQAQAQTPITSFLCNTGIVTICPPDAAAGQAQAQTFITIAPLCPPPANAGGQAQAQTPVTVTCGMTFLCASGQAQPQTPISIPLCSATLTNCQGQGLQAQTYSVPPFCLPANAGSQAQAPAHTVGCTFLPPCYPPQATGGQPQAQAQAGITNTIALCQTVIACTGVPFVC